MNKQDKQALLGVLLFLAAIFIMGYLDGQDQKAEHCHNNPNSYRCTEY